MFGIEIDEIKSYSIRAAKASQMEYEGLCQKARG